MLFYDKLSDYPYGIDADYIDTETERFELQILQLTPENKRLIIENITDDLLFAYYTERENVSKKGAKADRGKMLAYYNALSSVITYICGKTDFVYTDAFIKNWERKTAGNYFPFGELMRTNWRAMATGNNPTAEPAPPQRKKPLKTFEDFIIIDNKAELIKKIKPIIQGAKAKKIAAIIRALIELRYILIDSGKYAELTRALNNCYSLKIDPRLTVRYISDLGIRKNNITDSDLNSMIDAIRL